VAPGGKVIILPEKVVSMLQSGAPLSAAKGGPLESMVSMISGVQSGLSSGFGEYKSGGGGKTSMRELMHILSGGKGYKPETEDGVTDYNTPMVIDPEKLSGQGMNVLQGLYEDERLLLKYSQYRWDDSDSMVSLWEQSTWRIQLLVAHLNTVYVPDL
jgi:hypothetical protein